MKNCMDCPRSPGNDRWSWKKLQPPSSNLVSFLAGLFPSTQDAGRDGPEGSEVGRALVAKITQESGDGLASQAQLKHN